MTMARGFAYAHIPFHFLFSRHFARCYGSLMLIGHSKVSFICSVACYSVDLEGSAIVHSLVCLTIKSMLMRHIWPRFVPSLRVSWMLILML